jgi:hypothetical protein
MSRNIIRFISFEYLISYTGGAWLAGAFTECFVRPLPIQVEHLLITLSAIVGAVLCAITVGRGARRFRLSLQRKDKVRLWMFYAAAFFVPFLIVIIVILIIKSDTGLVLIFSSLALLVLLLILVLKHTYRLKTLASFSCAVLTMAALYFMGLISSFVIYLFTGVIDMD